MHITVPCLCPASAHVIVSGVCGGCGGTITGELMEITINTRVMTDINEPGVVIVILKNEADPSGPVYTVQLDNPKGTPDGLYVARVFELKPLLSWAPEVIADSSGKWCGNGLRFATKEEAEGNVRDLMGRWMLVRETRVVETADPVNYRWTSSGLEGVGAAAGK